MAVIASVISVYFYLRVIVMMYFHEEEESVDVTLNRGIVAIVATSSAVILGIGFFPSTLMEIARSSIPF
jgi:NADH-quinone oxidoreductase subunit N